MNLKDFFKKNFDFSGFNTPHFESIKIDSFRIAIPYNLFTRVPAKLDIHRSRFFEVDNDGIIISEKLPYFEINNEITRLKMSYKNYPLLGAHLETVVTSRFFNYMFNNKETVFNCANYVQHFFNFMKKLGFDFDETLVKTYSFINDIDISQDVFCECSHMDIIINNFVGGVVYRKNNINSGYQYSSRKSATPSKPFAKLYDKELEIHLKSPHLQYYKMPFLNRYRFEVTVKNKGHFDYLLRRFNFQTNLYLFDDLQSIEKIFNYIMSQTFYDLPLKIKKNSKKNNLSMLDSSILYLLHKNKIFDEVAINNLYVELVKGGYINQDEKNHSVKKSRFLKKLLSLLENN